MKRRNRSLEIFSLSFLDLISCGFGAVVLLILISKTGEDVSSASIQEAQDIVAQLTLMEKRIADNLDHLSQLQEERNVKQEKALTAENELKKLSARQADAQEADQKADEDLQGMELVAQSLNRASIQPATNTKKRDDEVGGIPVDSDYILFIVDTSGSMQSIWPKVTKEMQNILKIHPKVKGFQIMNDNGLHLISAYRGKWIPDTANRRANVFNTFKSWRSNSNSSPVEGLEVALRTYAKPQISLSIYILGDEYSGSSFDAVIDRLNVLNRNKATGGLLAKIHAVGFVSAGITGRFSVLMREVTKQNGGTFLALSRK
ncbi:hypothetical protein [Sneathiella aquimaris]|uniref:hypothetical protein n=1 Tax=Sneathiella aquimaris TaxID=2599305 RepID=UPI00146A70AB|nr:hypothetical protein [Sneathiella aquimaris]